MNISHVLTKTEIMRMISQLILIEQMISPSPAFVGI